MSRRREPETLHEVLWSDHLVCPGLGRWLPREVDAGGVVRVWEAPRAKHWKPHRALLRLTQGWPQWRDGEARIDALLLITWIGAPAPDASGALRDLSPAGRIIDLATPVRRFADRFRPVRRRRQATDWAIERAAMWKRLGGTALEQWVSLQPTETLVTIALGPSGPVSSGGRTRAAPVE